MRAAASVSVLIAAAALAVAPTAAVGQSARQVAATSLDQPLDPLTPKAVERAAPSAPGAVSAPPDLKGEPLAALITRADRLDDPGSGGGHRDDRVALARFYAENGGRPVWTTPAGPSERAVRVRGELAAAAAFGLDPAAFALPDVAAFVDADAQASHELAVGMAVLTYARHARGARVDPTSISRMIDMKPRPFEPATVLSAVLHASDPAGALRALQPRHPGFANLVKALADARASSAPADTIRRIEVNLERWRWLPDDLGAFHIRNNVPEQITRVYKQDQVVFTERIVVGKPNTPTPMMSSDMQFVIFHPSWGVPNGIKNNEIAPLLRRAAARNQSWFEGSGHAARALERHQLRVFQGGREVSPDAVDWTRVDINAFHFTQPPSNRNVLGVVKFRFPNRYDVYMHDTQEKSLFAQSVRAYSHGCMRVQNPMALAEVILAHDKGWSSERVRGHVGSGRTSDITLTTPVPVHLTYFTASADETGKLTLHGDVYGMDGRVATALAGKPIALAAASAEAPATKSAVRRQDRKPVKQVASSGAPAFNPFSGLVGN
jgi:murein L,D-transpeptidase YcbB/YkuD